MKRSEINRVICEGKELMHRLGWTLPPFGYFSPGEISKLGGNWAELWENMLGWDITDFGSGDFAGVGLLMFTVRNGRAGDDHGRPYAEKLLISQENQHTPMHFHWSKREDIINRGGGNLMIQLYNSNEEEGLAQTEVAARLDGHVKMVPAGTILRIEPGQSISLPSGQYHEFWAEPGCGPVLIGEVSSVNDDHTDNRFLRPVGRFPEVEEDEAPIALLYTEYPQLSQG